MNEADFLKDDFIVSDYLPEGTNLEDISQETNQNWKTLYRYIYEMNSRGELWNEGHVDHQAKLYLLDKDKVRKTFEKIYKEHQDEFGIKNKTLAEQTEIWLKKNWEFKRNLVTQTVEVREQGSEDFAPVNANTIYRKLMHTNSKFSMDKLQVLLGSDFVDSYDPFLNYFEGLPKWDRVDHIAKLAGFISTNDDEFFKSQFKKCLVRCIRCGLGERENRIVFVLVGEKQNTGKSTFIRFLAPFGMKYYTESVIHAKDKDTTFALAENFIYNLEELASLSNVDVNRLKSIISTASINERKPYARDTIQVPRRANFFASTNKIEFLTDTENTRWLIFQVNDISWGYTKEIDIHKVWAQAYHLYKDPIFEDQLTRDEVEKRDSYNKNFEIEDDEKTLIKMMFTVPMDGLGQFMINSDILAELEKKFPWRKFNSRWIGKIMTQLGFVRDIKKVNGHTVRGFYVKRQDGGINQADITQSKMF